jgi:hypothetical protein
MDTVEEYNEVDKIISSEEKSLSLPDGYFKMIP